jgi:hypothetical protein
MSISQVITPFSGDAPNSNDQTEVVFDNNANAFAEDIVNLAPELNTWASQANATKTEINTLKNQASASAAAALQSQIAAETVSGLADYCGVWAAGSYTLGQSVFHQGNFYIANSTTTSTPSTDTSWTLIPKLGFEPSIKPTLNLDMVNSEYAVIGTDGDMVDAPFEDIMTVTRSTTATRIDHRGVIVPVGINEKRINFDPVTGKRSLLAEENRANLFTYSEDFSNTVWDKRPGSAIESNVILAPDGTLTADKHYNTDTTTSTTYIALPGAFSTDNTVYCASMFVKRGSQPSARIRMYAKTDSIDSAIATFNFDTETISIQNEGLVTGAIGDFEKLGNGWFRVWVSANMLTGTSTTGTRFVPSRWDLPTTIGSEYGYIWGAQLEVGSTPSSYIKTEASAVTRTADSVTRTFADGEFNSSEFSVYWWVGSNNAFRSVVAGGNQGGVDRVGFASSVSFQIVLSGSVVINRTLGDSVKKGDKFLAVFKKGAYRLYRNGVLDASSSNTSLSASVPFTTINLNRNSLEWWIWGL